MTFIYKSSGVYLGFISHGSLFSRDGNYLGWVDGQFVWDSNGKFRGQLSQDKYVIINQFAVPPVPKAARPLPPSPPLPNPPPNIPPVNLPTGWVDSF